MTLEHSILSLSGLSVGDAFGQRLFNHTGDTYVNSKSLPPGLWMWTAETQMALSVVEELRQRSWIDQDYLARRMAWRYSTDPSRGYGDTTRKVLQQIAQGEHFRTKARSFFNGGSYGCSGVSRVVPLGAFYAKSPAKAAREAPLATAITHLHPESLAAAQAVAVAASIAADPAHPTGADFLRMVIEYVTESRVRQSIKQVTAYAVEDLESCLKYLCCDEFRTVQSSVPFALWCAAHHLNDFENALWATISGHGHSNTTCAITGGILALSNGGVPDEWIALREPLPVTGLFTNIDKPRPRTAEQRKPAPLPAELPKSAGVVSMVSSRIDPLTNLPNLLGLLEWADRRVEDPGNMPMSMIVIHLAPLWDVNKKEGRTAGDNLIKTCGTNLQKLNIGPVFRAGGDKFVVMPEADAQAMTYARQISSMVTLPECRLPRIAVIHFPQKDEIVDGCLVACLSEAIKDTHYHKNDGLPREFNAGDIRTLPDFSWIMLDMTTQLRRLGMMVEEANRMAFTDPISQLPNFRAAMLTLEASLQRAENDNDSLAVLLFDGDNLRKFNAISFQAGDEAIRLMGSTLKSVLRGDDFLARWRSGDEFIFILPGTTSDIAGQIAERARASVETVSKSWKFETTISGGVSVYPQDGKTVQELIDVAEKRMHYAKETGRNKCVM